ncbi:DUF1003 domain-containing protein [Demequina aurantiaca]|uniref:DUF1003 domain-containing protein n=1 Tax=Demequina aurantiaca TaxID=676200 RepID=UPI0007809E83|nr:DUF1003 domain-containing protein [Demequina aurantiaca]
MAERLDRPKSDQRRLSWRRGPKGSDRFGAFSEGIARFLGTPRFLLYLTVFCIAWIAWNIWAPAEMRFDSAARGFTALTLMLSLQASYAAPLILLAQNRQDDRDKVGAEQDRQRAERSLADTEYLAREVAALRHAVSDTATRDFVRSELRALLEELRSDDEAGNDERPRERSSSKTERPKK